MLEALVPMVIALAIFSIPLVRILTKHQKEMAELMRRQPDGSEPLARRVQLLEAEVQELKAVVHTQAIQMDDAQRLMTPPPVESIRS